MRQFKKAFCVALVGVLALAIAACGGGETQEPMQVPEVTTAPVSLVETVYGPLAFPQELYDELRHTEVIEGSIAVEIFYMMGTEGEKELYRIYFADPQAGTHAGYLKTDSGEISVSYSLCVYDDEIFDTEDDRKLYHNMMDAFSVIMNSLHDDERFSEEGYQTPVGQQEVKLRYWTVTLPESIQYTETEENGNYRVNFFGEVSGERIDLYMVGLGDVESEATIGTYTVDGVKRSVYVQTYESSWSDILNDDNYEIAYHMMDTINDVIQQIQSSEYYSAQ